VISWVVSTTRALCAIEYWRIDIREEPKRIAMMRTEALDLLLNKLNLRAIRRRTVARTGIHQGRSQL
jgi:hypothetical protein